MTTQIGNRVFDYSPVALPPLPWNDRERTILLGNIELFADGLSRCFSELTPATKAEALELGRTLGRLKSTLKK